MPVIRIDTEVERELERLAVGYGFVFGTPNQVLRRHFGLEGRTNESGGEESMVNPQSDGVRKLHGRRLARQHGLQVAKSYAHVGGTWYTVPTEFPAAFFDNDGYIVFPTEVEFAARSELSVLETVNVHQGIAAMPGYVHCEHSHS